MSKPICQGNFQPGFYTNAQFKDYCLNSNLSFVKLIPVLGETGAGTPPWGFFGPGGNKI